MIGAFLVRVSSSSSPAPGGTAQATRCTECVVYLHGANESEGALPGLLPGCACSGCGFPLYPKVFSRMVVSLSNDGKENLLEA